MCSPNILLLYFLLFFTTAELIKDRSINNKSYFYFYFLNKKDRSPMIKIVNETVLRYYSWCFYYEEELELVEVSQGIFDYCTNDVIYLPFKGEYLGKAVIVEICEDTKWLIY